MSIELLLGIAGFVIVPVAAVLTWRITSAHRDGKQEIQGAYTQKDIANLEDDVTKLKDQMQAVLIQNAVDRANVQNVMGAIASMRLDMDKRFDKIEGLLEKREVTGTHRIPKS